MQSFLQTLDRKVKFGSVASVIVFIVSYLLVRFVLHRQLTTEEQGFILGIVPIAVGWVTAYMTKHDPKLLSELDNIGKLL